MACVEGTRKNFLAETLWMDNRKWLYRDPALLAAKLDVMAESPYNFMRGTQRLHWLDAIARKPSVLFLQEPESRHVLILAILIRKTGVCKLIPKVRCILR